MKIAWGFRAVFFPLVAFRVNHLLFSVLAQFPTNLLIVPPSISLLSRGNKQWYQTPFFPLPPVKPQWEVPAYGHLLQIRLASLFCSHMPQSQGSFLQHSSPPACLNSLSISTKLTTVARCGKLQRAYLTAKNYLHLSNLPTSFAPFGPKTQRLSEKYMTTSPLYLL